MNVFVYWEHPNAKERWAYIDLCIRSIRLHCGNTCTFHLIDSQNLHTYVPDGIYPDEWKTLPLGIKSDCVRAAVLHRFGGMYVDADTLMLRSPKELESAHDFSGMVWPKPPRRVIAGYCHIPFGSVVGEQWVRNIATSIENKKMGWTDLGERCLTPAVDASTTKQFWSLETFLPVNIDISPLPFFSTLDWKTIVKSETVAFGLNHSWFTSRRKSIMQNIMAPSFNTKNSIMLKQLIEHVRGVTGV